MRLNFRGKPKGSIFVTAFTFLLNASPLFAEQTWNQSNLTGEEAIAHLKNTTQYESLSEAINIARYSMREVEGAPAKAQARSSSYRSH